MTDERHVFVATVEDRFNGVLLKGTHDPDGQACWRESAEETA
jgi:hypothetical protein